MVRLRSGLLAACLLACGSEGTIYVDGAAGTGPLPPAAGTGGEEPPPVAEGGTGGTSGTPEDDESDVIIIADGSFSDGAPPPASAGDPAMPTILSVTGPTAVTNGGSAILHIQLSAPVTSPTFVVGLEGDTGYHTVTGADPDGDGTYDITVQVAAEASMASLVLSVALVDAAGNAGAYSQVTISLVQSGTGDVKITLSFDRVHDLDLHVLEPNGEEIEYTNPDSATGGKLDLDSGANCETSAANSENIFWPPGGAPAGQYVVSVYNYQQCSEGPIAFTVRVAYDSVVNTYEGTFADGTASEQVTSANVMTIATFTRGL